MIQRAPLPRSTKRIPVRRRKPRRVSVLRDQAYKNWLKERNCVVCRKWTLRDIDPAHTENNGMRSKGPDSSCAPLCRSHHRQYDAGRKAFELEHGVDMKNEAAAHYAAFLLSKGDDPC